MDAVEPDLEQYLDRVAGIDRSDLSTHFVRAAIIEQATILDYAVNELIALPLAANQAAANLLASRSSPGSRTTSESACSRR